MNGDGALSACTSSIASQPWIAVPQGLAHGPTIQIQEMDSKLKAIKSKKGCWELVNWVQRIPSQNVKTGGHLIEFHLIESLDQK